MTSEEPTAKVLDYAPLPAARGARAIRFLALLLGLALAAGAGAWAANRLQHPTYTATGYLRVEAGGKPSPDAVARSAAAAATPTGAGQLLAHPIPDSLLVQIQCTAADAATAQRAVQDFMDDVARRSRETRPVRNGVPAGLDCSWPDVAVFARPPVPDAERRIGVTALGALAGAGAYVLLARLAKRT